MNPLIYAKKTNKQATIVVGKMRSLISSLQNANKAFKHIAGRCSDRKAQILVFGMATDSFQSYRELSLHAQVLRGDTDFNETMFTAYQYDNNALENEPSQNMDKVLEDCVYIEKGLISEFRKLLNDHVISGDLRKLLQEQLNGFLCAFAKIKMLNSLHVSSNNFMNIW